jgi:hypothetical protein
MKRIKIILPIFLLLIVFLLLLSRPPKADSKLPRFVPAISQPVGPFGSEHYEWGDAIPFRDGKGWVWTALSRSNRHSFLYDLDKRIVLGELFNAGAVFANHDQTKLLCDGPASPYTSFKNRMSLLLSRLSFGKINLATKANQIETFWILDLRNNSAVRIGDLSQFPGTGSRWVPAPGFRYAYNIPTTMRGDQEFFLCDLEAGTLKKIHLQIHLRDELQGWWDDHTVLGKDSADNFVLFDVVTRKTQTLFSAEAILQFLKDNNLTNDPAGITSFRNWNGRDYDLYFAGNRKSGLDTNTTFLIKVERPGPTLKFLYRNFQFKWSGHLNVTATHYLYNGYSGAPGKGGNGGVVLRDLINNTERDIVPPDNSGQYSLARLCGDTVIYSRNKVLWRTDINGTNATRLFPPAGSENK